MANQPIKKSIIIVAAATFAGVILFLAANAPSAHASFLGDFWKNSIVPFFERSGIFGSPSATSTQPAAPNVPLYKPVVDYENAVVTAVKKASPAVVAITISKNVPIIENCPINPFSDLPPEFQQLFGDQLPGGFSAPCNTGKTKLQEVGGGSGFIISSDGLILTNKHVVSDAQASYTVFTNDGKKYDAKVLARDPAQDLAVIKIDARNLPTVELGNSDNIELGQTAIAIGNALGEFRNTVSVGVVSGLSRTVTASGSDFGTETIQGVIQTDAAINPGNSGGPLLNLLGQVIGIDTAVVSSAQNIGFAIPINRAKRDIDSVKTSGKIQAPYIGVRYLPVTPDLAQKENLPVDYGALLRGSSDGPAIIPGSPADKAGLRAEDIILEANGRKIDQNHSLSSYVADMNVGDAVTLKINRGGKEMEIKVTLEKRPANL